MDEQLHVDRIASGRCCRDREQAADSAACAVPALIGVDLYSDSELRGTEEGGPKGRGGVGS